ncbi:hypothetical protein COW36_02710 [bacterium (Candidatus Blackallbacteria) CG17_big_fil_post_rev_8_21_14_2_50_48_46]|uniref:protein O-GlcNAc transferase n=1 Tax=bacterium (Candidatus Blackallbacteria) CG17_big_fil_post_rev_8_21_14_2_50_48_46 TaxID=2014261 RepID=A0A2M7GA69_9BACT|nr:MAG: hypothetical protein COW64_12765 [bacterium (Candidatus Blackallbacteria) CG18_big_fil_WC_8_21_14_2_50_49_26]PIW19040.1 MAG: hypothetical protein COW36_02710 [bacterium (Candidatus Blackallbacteria) CG17_big_fil_post_rev_8_21_14_2_50_48_46]PIW44593.1 MAG: hypothetical protein COW20_23410 [bacterium (Candidatus Blackallbacteria) CG13_big_fil_rev_8_21_14_2_50_49_14]
MSVSELQARLKSAYALLFSGQIASARQILEALQLEFPSEPDIWNGLGLLSEQIGERAAAQAYYLEALRLNPAEAEYHNNLALLLEQQGDSLAALMHFERAFQLSFSAHSAYNLVKAFLRAEKQDEACEVCRQLLMLEPEHLFFHQCLFELWHDLSAQILWYQQLLRRHTLSGQACYFLACLYEQENQTQKFLYYLDLSLELLPDWELPRRQKMLASLKLDYFEAQNQARQIYTAKPSQGNRLMLFNLLPAPVFASRQAQQTALLEFEALLDQALQRSEPLQDFRLMSLHFYLAYQNLEDRVWNERIYRLYQPLIPALSQELSLRSNGPRRIGIVSRFLYRHAVTFCFGGIFEELARHAEIELFFFPIHEQTYQPDQTLLDFQGGAKQVIPLSLAQSVLQSAQQIRQTELDLLIYPEIGMDPMAYMLAYSRLAPVQLMLAGHPLTSGIASLDYFVTSQELELPSCQSHYSEQWVGLPGLIQYARPALPVFRSRSDLGLPEDQHLYFCPMTLFKIHPDLDLCFAEILRRDPKAQIVLFRYLNTSWHEVLQRRFAHEMPDVAERIQFLPFQSFEGFLQILRHADLVLDSLYFSGGNTSFLAFALGVPVVTLPSAYLKARSTLGLYQRMGLNQTVANSREDYIEKALALGTDPDWRKTFSQLIQARSALIFDQTEWNGAFQNWLLQMIA